MFAKLDLFLESRLEIGSALNCVLAGTEVLGLVLRTGRGVYSGVIGRAIPFTVFTLSNINGGGVGSDVSVNLNTCFGILGGGWSVER